MHFSDDENSSQESKPQPPVEIPPASLSPDALQGIIESFIMREGTDYGREEVSFEKKVHNIKNKISRGEIHLVFDPNTESVTFLTENEWKRLRKSSST